MPPCAVPDQHRENQKIAEGAQAERHEADDDIGRNARQNHRSRAEPFRKFAVKDSEGERDNLHDQQHDHHIHAAQPAGIAEYRRHMDDGADAVDVKEVRDDKRTTTLLFLRIMQQVSFTLRSVCRTIFRSRFNAVLLMDMAQHGEREHQPPARRQQEGNARGKHGADADCVAKLNQQQGEHQRDRGAADVTQAVAQR